MERLPVKPADNDFFSNLEECQHNGKDERLYQGRIDQGSISEPIGKVQFLSSQHDLCKRKRADLRIPKAYVTNRGNLCHEPWRKCH